MRALVVVLVVVGWVATAVAAWLLGLIQEHVEAHDEGLWKKASA